MAHGPLFNCLYYELKQLQSQHDGLGTIVNVLVDEEQGLISRTFQPGYQTVSGKKHDFTEEQVNEFYQNELYWLDKLDGKWLPEFIANNDDTQTIIQRYYGPCLLDYLHTDLHTRIPDLTEQIIEMYAFFKDNNVFKRNGSLSNLTYNKGQVIAFDFKWAKERPAGIEMEKHSYHNWLNKINDKLPGMLELML